MPRRALPLSAGVSDVSTHCEPFGIASTHTTPQVRGVSLTGVVRGPGLTVTGRVTEDVEQPFGASTLAET